MFGYFLNSTYQWVHCFKPCLHWFMHGFPRNNPWRLDFHSWSLVWFNRTETINGVAQCVHDSAKHSFSDWYINDWSGSFDDVSFLDFSNHIVRLRGAYLSLPRTTIPTLSVSRLSAMPLTPLLNSTISPACTLVSPNTLAIPSPIDMTDPNSFKSFYNITKES